MGKLIWIILMFLCTACTKPYQGFVLDGKINGKAPDRLILNYIDSLGQNVSDTVVLKNGNFCFRGGINEPTQAMLTTGEELRSWEDKHYVRVWLEPSVLRYEATGNDLQTYTLTGSATENEAQEQAKVLAPFTTRMQALNTEYYKPGSNRDSLNKLMEPLTREYERLQRAFLDSRFDSYIAPAILELYVSRMKADEVQEYYDRWTDRVRQSPAGKGIADEIRKLRAGSPGSVATMFSAVDINGKTFDMADLHGKYILLDFWASWCKPCRASNSHLKSIYRKYHGDGLEVVCVASDDGKPDLWRNAVKQDGIGAFHHVLRGLQWTADHRPDNSKDISDKYGIHTLPTKILIDRKGIIIGRYGGGGDTEKDMDLKLKEIFGK